MKENVVKVKSMEFAIRIVNLYKYLTSQKQEFVLSKQVLRSGTSVGANVRESEHASSNADFVNKLTISLKECNETLYWLELLYKTDYITEDQYTSINEDALALIKILVSIIKTSKNKEQ